MLFELDTDQRMLQRTVRDVLAKECPSSLVRAVVDKGEDPGAVWRTVTGLGWTELTDPAEAVELAIVLEELGRVADPTPFLATVTQFAPLVSGGDTKPGAESTGAVAYEGVTARRDGNGWILDGTAKFVLDGDRADTIAVVTEEGVFVVPASEADIERIPVFDPVLHVADVSFTNVRAGEPRAADLERARHVALTGMALTMVGACRGVLDRTLEHVRTRQQFGVPVGSFQAVKHKAVDMYVAIERAAAVAFFAALMISADDPRRRVAASMAKAAAGECQSVVFRHGLQLHGAMGFTWENDVQFVLKRAKAGELFLGGAAEHRALVARECHAIEL